MHSFPPGVLPEGLDGLDPEKMEEWLLSQFAPGETTAIIGGVVKCVRIWNEEAGMWGFKIMPVDP